MNNGWKNRVILAIQAPSLLIATLLTVNLISNAPNLDTTRSMTSWMALLSLAILIYGVCEITIQKYLSVPLPEKNKHLPASRRIYPFYLSCFFISMLSFAPQSFINSSTCLVLFVIANVTLFYQGVFFFLRELRTHEIKAKKISIIYSALLSLILIGVSSQHNHMDPQKALRLIFNIQVVSFSFFAFASLAKLSLNNSKRTNSNALVEFLSRILGASSRRKSNLLNFTLLLVIPCSTLIANYFLGKDNSFQIISFQQLIGVILTFPASKSLSFDLMSVGISLRLNDNQVTNFILRHNSNNDYSAVITGIRTSTYFIDHDPDLVLESSLPVTIQQIRTDEIDRGIHRALGKLRLNSTTDNHRTSGVINPEVSHRPCTDILKLFAALHLYLAPTIDRRIKGLIHLFKVIDPGLYKIIDEMEMKNALAKNMWLFYLDYSWVDQNIITSGENTRYSLTVGTKITQAEKHSIFQYLKAKRQIGSFLIVSPQARDRLNQESLEFRKIIEAVPLKNKETGEEFLSFIIKFEDLIPKLQKYFGLDAHARTLIDFEPSVESTRQLNLVKLQVEQSKSYKKIQTIASSLSEFRWKGYREKDAALETLVECYERAEHLIKLTFANKEDELKSEAQLNHSLFVSYIEKVGYPSQLIHSAQKKKYTLRSIDELLKVCQTPSDSRYHEAWLTLAACDSMRFTTEEIHRCIVFFNDTISDTKVASDGFIQSKCLEAFINLGKDLRRNDLDLIVSLFNQLARNLINIKASTNLCCLILDGRGVLEQKIRGRIRFEKANEEILSSYFGYLTKLHGDRSPDISSLNSRWEQYLAGINRS